MTTLTYDVSYSFYSSGGWFNSVVGQYDITDLTTTSWDLIVTYRSPLFCCETSRPQEFIGSGNVTADLIIGDTLTYDLGSTFQNGFSLGSIYFTSSANPTMGVVHGITNSFIGSHYVTFGVLHPVPMPIMGSGTLSLLILITWAIARARREFHNV